MTQDTLIARLRENCCCEADAEQRADGGWEGRMIKCDNCLSLDRIEALEARERELVEALAKYASGYCEGWCEDAPPNAEFDCGGCPARLVLQHARALTTKG